MSETEGAWEPDTIYLTEVDWEDPEYPLVWASITEHSDGVKYIRADLVAALVEAAKETAAILQAAVVSGKLRGRDSYRIGGVYLRSVSDALDATNAALAAMNGGE